MGTLTSLITVFDEFQILKSLCVSVMTFKDKYPSQQDYSLCYPF